MPRGCGVACGVACGVVCVRHAWASNGQGSSVCECSRPPSSAPRMRPVEASCTHASAGASQPRTRRRLRVRGVRERSRRRRTQAASRRRMLRCAARRNGPNADSTWRWRRATVVARMLRRRSTWIIRRASCRRSRPTWINPEIWHHNGAGRLGDQFGETAFDLDPRRRVSCAPAGGSPRMDDATYPGFMTPRTLDL